MKRIYTIMAMVFLAALSSCSEEALLPEHGAEGDGAAADLVPMSFSAGLPTKTYLEGNVVKWSENDEIVVFDNMNNLNKFETESVNGSEAIFKGMVKAKTTDFYAVYPYSSDVKATDEHIYLDLRENQTPVSGTFAEEHNISVAHAAKAVGDDHVDGVIFKNVCGLIQFTVPARLAKVTSVSFTANRNIAGSFSIAKDGLGVAEYQDGVKSVYMDGAFEAGSTFYFVVTPGDLSGFNIKVTAENGATYTKSSAKTINVEAGKMKNLGVIDFTAEPTASASHTYVDGVLTGTTVTLQLGLPTGMEDYVDGLNASLVNSNGQAIRTINKNSGVTTSEVMSVALGNVYIPSGTYKIYVTYSLNGVAKEETITVNVPRPEFNVTTEAYTSYSKYREGDLYTANYGCDPETVYGMKCSVNISDAVLKQYGLSSCTVYLTDPYGSDLPLYGTVNKNSSSCFSMEQQSVNAWGEYSLGAEVTFDGVTRTWDKTLYITGLPYTAAPPKNSGSHPWSGSANSWGSDFVRLHANTISQTFYVPYNINVDVYQNVRIFTRSNDCTYKLSLSGNSLYSVTQSSYVPADKTTTVKDTYQSVLTSSNPVLQISNSYGTADFGLEYTNVKVYEIKVLYR